MKNANFFSLVGALLVTMGFGFSQNVQASIISPDSATVLSGIPQNGGGGVAELVDGDSTPGPNWFGLSMTTQDPTVRLTLGGTFDLASVSIWNNGGGIDNDTEGLKDFDLNFLDTSLTQIGSFSGSILDLQTVQTLSINASGVSFVDLIFQSSHGASYALLTEIQFEGTTSSVPAPASIAILMFGLLGLCYRDRQSN